LRRAKRDLYFSGDWNIVFSPVLFIYGHGWVIVRLNRIKEIVYARIFAAWRPPTQV
jgi:hypothetical protein